MAELALDIGHGALGRLGGDAAEGGDGEDADAVADRGA